MNVTCSHKGCQKSASAIAVVRLREGRDKGKTLSIWVCNDHLEGQDTVATATLARDESAGAAATARVGRFDSTR